MMTPSGSEVLFPQEEVGFLRTQVDRLQELVAELLAKNQHLREALEEGSVQAGTSRSWGAKETGSQRFFNDIKLRASFVYAPEHWKRGEVSEETESGD